jgi:hypothetical protein
MHLEYLFIPKSLLNLHVSGSHRSVPLSAQLISCLQQLVGCWAILLADLPYFIMFSLWKLIYTLLPTGFPPSLRVFRLPLGIVSCHWDTIRVWATVFGPLEAQIRGWGTVWIKSFLGVWHLYNRRRVFWAYICHLIITLFFTMLYIFHWVYHVCLVSLLRLSVEVSSRIYLSKRSSCVINALLGIPLLCSCE